ncbi:MAG: DUF4860 domain-containing protein [Lachnospiraceae bacterium]|nr:DUF4860 domain-containing protein [Lachnospiraceae bacterium]
MNRRKNIIVDIFPILLFLVFTLSALGVVIFSAQIYRSIVGRAEGRFNTDTAAAYVSEKFRNHDDRGRISVSEYLGNDAIAIEETIKEIHYITYIYVHNGYLRELFVEKGALEDYTADDGTGIIPMKEMKIEQPSDTLVKLSFTDTEGVTGESYVSLKSRPDSGKSDAEAGKDASEDGQ